MTTAHALVVAAVVLALALVFHPLGPSYSVMPFGTNGTGALRLDARTGAIDVCSFEKLPADPAHSRMTCGPTWPR